MFPLPRVWGTTTYGHLSVFFNAECTIGKIGCKEVDLRLSLGEKDEQYLQHLEEDWRKRRGSALHEGEELTNAMHSGGLFYH